jgi:hypothetical protein
MGLFSKKIKYPELEDNHPASKQLSAVEAPLK